MTRDEILNMEAGPELDAIVAERVMGWRRMWGPGYDYDGPRKPDEILVPPRISDKQFNHFQFPPRGPIAFGFFGIPKYSTSIADAWEVWESLSVRNAGLLLHRCTDGWAAVITKTDSRDLVWAGAETAPLAICRAALIATLEDE